MAGTPGVHRGAGVEGEHVETPERQSVATMARPVVSPFTIDATAAGGRTSPSGCSSSLAGVHLRAMPSGLP